MEVTAVLGSILTGVIGFLFWKIKQFDAKEFLTRDQIEKIIYKETQSLQSEFDKVESKIDTMSEQIIKMGQTLVRIDERMKNV